MKQPLPKVYAPAEAEPAIRARWRASDAFHPDPGRVLDGSSQGYAIVIPPPNVTAALHLGHALNNTLQDILIRHHRMAGFETLWLPGTDHAGIATQTVVDKRLTAAGEPALAHYRQLEEEGQGGRDTFIAKVQDWKDEFEARISHQLEEMGCSCDWERQRFTMDEQCARAVREAFFQLFKDGLIYRGKRLVNWDPVTQTALADDEVEDVEVEGHFWYMQYPLIGDPVTINGETIDRVTVATTRPETMLGDTAVALNPRDPRAEALRGRKLRLPIVNREIPIIEDEYVVLPIEFGGDPSDAKAQFATGYLKVTPAHDPNDWEIGQRHDLPVINTLSPSASISKDHGWPAEEWEVNSHDEILENLLGMDRYEAREAIVDWFRVNNLLEEVKPYNHSVGHSYRSHVAIEPYLSDQWYVKVTDERLAGAALRSMAKEQRSPGTACAWKEGDPFADTSTTSRPPQADEGAAPPASRDREGAVPLASRDREGAVPSASRDREGAVPLASRDCEGAVPLTSRDREGAVPLASRDREGAVPLASRDCEGAVPLASRDREGAVPLASRDREGAVSPTGQAATPRPPRGPLDHYLITFTCYGTWLHGDSRGSVKQPKNLPGTPVLTGDEREERAGFDRLKQEPFELDETRRKIVAETIVEVCEHRGWKLHALNVRSNHLHAVISADVPPEQAMNDIKSYATRRLREANLAEADRRVWTRHGSTRYLKTEAHFLAACRYVTEEQGEDLGGVVEAWRTESPASVGDCCAGEPLPHSRGSLGQEERDGLRFFPERYAKTFQTWHENIRDWCISRQLWWGHRIPVWHKRVHLTEKNWADHLAGNVGLDSIIEQGDKLGAALAVVNSETGETVDPERDLMPVVAATEGEYDLYVCKLDDDEHATWLEQDGFVRDPDVLDTWFSSALWPLSTMGWPDKTDLLQAYNPSNVLCTAREIITLWVSRMVMFNQYFVGRLPFPHVFIHAMIQDGEGRKMSKSLGNGVDPLDIIHSHGSDAMRFTLCQMTTNTQDVRMPVVFDEESQKNTSPKFDIGRNFCNKLWNATAFAMHNLQSGPIDPNDGELALADRWILSRLADTIAKIEAAIASYQFNVYAQHIYDLFWRDFCDFYVEAIKPTVGDNAHQRSVLYSVIDSILRLLHPICPFITESLHERLKDFEATLVAGLTLKPAELCTRAGWPIADASLRDDEAEAEFDRMRELIGAIRETRSQRNVQPKRQIVLHTDAETLAQIEKAGALVPTLCGLERIVTEPATGDQAVITALGKDHAVSNLTDALDAGAEKQRLEKNLAEVAGKIIGLQKRLENPGYVDKAPAHLVEQTRGQLTQLEEEQKTIETALAKLS